MRFSACRSNMWVTTWFCKFGRMPTRWRSTSIRHKTLLPRLKKQARLLHRVLLSLVQGLSQGSGTRRCGSMSNETHTHWGFSTAFSDKLGAPCYMLHFVSFLVFLFEWYSAPSQIPKCHCPIRLTPMWQWVCSQHWWSRIKVDPTSCQFRVPLPFRWMFFKLDQVWLPISWFVTARSSKLFAIHHIGAVSAIIPSRRNPHWNIKWAHKLNAKPTGCQGEAPLEFFFGNLREKQHQHGEPRPTISYLCVHHVFIVGARPSNKWYAVGVHARKPNLTFHFKWNSMTFGKFGLRLKLNCQKKVEHPLFPIFISNFFPQNSYFYESTFPIFISKNHFEAMFKPLYKT